MILAAAQFQVLADGRISLQPFSVALFGKDKGDGRPVEINTIQGRVAYIKHPETKHFIVCARRDDLTVNPPSFRYTLDVASPQDLAEAHRWVSDHRAEYAINEVHDIETSGDTSSFLVRDPDMNWWEIAAPS